MDVLQVVLVGVTGTVLALAIKKQAPEFALLVALGTGILLFLFVVEELSSALDVFREMAQRAGIRSDWLEILFKVIGISYIAEFGIQVCADAGESSIAGKIELAGKVFIMAVSAPILYTLMDTLLDLVG